MGGGYPGDGMAIVCRRAALQRRTVEDKRGVQGCKGCKPQKVERRVRMCAHDAWERIFTLAPLAPLHFRITARLFP